MDVGCRKQGRRMGDAGLLGLLAVTSLMAPRFAEKTSHRVPTGGGKMAPSEAAEALTSQALAEAFNGDGAGGKDLGGWAA